MRYTRVRWIHELADEPIPPLDAINAQAEFAGEEITADDFERVWNEARKWFDDR